MNEYTCKYCGKKFTKKNALAIHELKCHHNPEVFRIENEKIDNKILKLNRSKEFIESKIKYTNYKYDHPNITLYYNINSESYIENTTYNNFINRTRYGCNRIGSIITHSTEKWTLDKANIALIKKRNDYKDFEILSIYTKKPYTFIKVKCKKCNTTKDIRLDVFLAGQNFCKCKQTEKRNKTFDKKLQQYLSTIFENSKIRCEEPEKITILSGSIVKWTCLKCNQQFKATAYDIMHKRVHSKCNTNICKFNLLKEFESEYEFKAFLENNDPNILLAILNNICETDPKFNPIKKDLEKALENSEKEDPISKLEEKYSSSNVDDEIEVEEETTPIKIDLDDEEQLDEIFGKFDEAYEEKEMTIEDAIKNTEKEIKIINKIDHLIAPELRKKIMKKLLNDKLRQFMELNS